LGTPVDNVMDLAFSLIHDIDLAKMAEDDFRHLGYNWLSFAIARFKECKANLTINENELDEKYFEDELTIEEQTILAYGVVYYWLHHKAMYSKLLKNAVNTKDFQQLSNANLLLRLNEMKEETRKEFLRLRKAYSKRYHDFQGWN
jgi:hypothetical protein